MLQISWQRKQPNTISLRVESALETHFGHLWLILYSNNSTHGSRWTHILQCHVWHLQSMATKFMSFRTKKLAHKLWWYCDCYLEPRRPNCFRTEAVLGLAPQHQSRLVLAILTYLFKVQVCCPSIVIQTIYVPNSSRTSAPCVKKICYSFIAALCENVLLYYFCRPTKHDHIFCLLPTDAIRAFKEMVVYP